MASPSSEPLRHLRRVVRAARRPLGALRRKARALWTRLWHRGRRRQAREMLQGLPGVRSVLFVCLGNICRSPYAEARLRQLSGGRIATASVGFIGPGRPSPEHGLAVAKLRGLDLSDHRSRVVTGEDLNRADLVVLVDPSHARRLRSRFGRLRAPVLVLGDLDPVPPSSRRIQDPWGRPAEDFHAVFERIDRCMSALLQALPVTAGPDGDPDPMHRSRNPGEG